MKLKKMLHCIDDAVASNLNLKIINKKEVAD